jgi:hypothetical protein
MSVARSAVCVNQTIGLHCGSGLVRRKKPRVSDASLRARVGLRTMIASSLKRILKSKEWVSNLVQCAWQGKGVVHCLEKAK